MTSVEEGAHRRRMMRRYAALAGALLAVTFLASCGTSKVSQVRPDARLDHPVRAVALAPSGGLLADAIGVELVNRGYNVVDTQQTSSLLVRMNMQEVEILNPRSLAAFKDQGIDAVLSVKAAGASDNTPESAAVRLNSTHTGRVITGVSWQNAWGGRRGSIADRVMRKNLTEAAKEIADALVTAVRP